MNRKLLAFVHIEKSAGTTLKSILRRHYGIGYCDVRTLSKKSKKTFNSSDLKVFLRLNPFITCVSGHSVKPWSDLETIQRTVEYITVLRDPVQRYISYYTYGTYGGGPVRTPWPFSFEQYMEKPKHLNFQTRKISGTEDVDIAKRNLADRFLVVGIMEDFDGFLILLRKKLDVGLDIRYLPLNVRSQESYAEILEKYQKQILVRNEADIELYRYVNEELLPAEKSSYGPNFERDRAEFLEKDGHRTLLADTEKGWREIIRRNYIGRVTGLMRWAGGLPWKGVY